MSTETASTTVQNMFDMTGRVAIVTGGGTHLGRAMATSLAELGASVVIASRRKELLESEASTLRDRGLAVEPYQCDVTDEDAVNAMVDSVVAEHGHIDVMVCNAGGSATTSYIPDASIDEFRKTMDMNATSTYICAQAAARHMIPEVTAGSSQYRQFTARLRPTRRSTRA